MYCFLKGNVLHVQRLFIHYISLIFVFNTFALRKPADDKTCRCKSNVSAARSRS